MSSFARSVLLSAGGAACWLALAACGSSTSTGPPTSASSTHATTTATPTAAATSAGAATVPTSCASIPTALISGYVGSITSVTPLGHPGQVSCEFFSAGAKSVVIVNIGRASPALFAVARAGAAGGGRTITPVSGLGTQAFSISKGGLVRGMEALSGADVLYAVTTTLTQAQDESLITQLMQLS